MIMEDHLILTNENVFLFELELVRTSDGYREVGSIEDFRDKIQQDSYPFF